MPKLILLAGILLFYTIDYVNASTRISGYLKSFTTVFLPQSSTTEASFVGVGLGRLRVRGLHYIGSYSLEAAYELAPRLESTSFVEPGLLQPELETGYRLFDFKRRLYSLRGQSHKALVLGHNLDRLELGFKLGSADFSVGRQALAFGAARVINPCDVVAPLTFSALDKEERFGVDALRLRIVLGDLNELDMGLVLGEGARLNNSVVFVRGRWYWRETDIVPLVVIFKENLLWGLELTRSFGGAGWWLEAAYTWAGIVDEGDTNKNYLGVSMGVDYNFGTVYGFIEGHFNGAGTAIPEQYGQNVEKTIYREAGGYLLGRYYLSPGMSWQLTPLLGVGGQGLINLGDGSVLWAPRIEYSLKQDVFVDIGTFWSWGRKPVSIDNLESIPRSEFALYRDVFFASIRWYF